jgi:D-alanyl-D-alanine carboxypeptidase (penicillin-binding protein 5/6)
MFFSRHVLVSLVLALLPLAAFGAAAKAHAKPSRPTATDADNSTAYKGAIIVDAATGNVLFEDRADVVSPPASMTKLMTFAVLHDKLASGALTLQTPVTVAAADSKIGGSQVWLKEKEVFPVEELLYAMMIHSANDAAYALARTAGGSVDAFVELMNAKARELGMTHTTFRSPHGLPPANRRIADGDLTTPRDFTLLCRYLLLKTDVLKYTSIKTRDFGRPVRATPVQMTNSDHLIGQIAGVDGLKTGFTNGAGFCLSATAQRDGRRVLVVLMGAPDSKTRDLKVAEFLARGFAALPPGSPAFVADKSANAARPAANAESPLSSPPAASGGGTPAASEPVIKLTIPGLKR